MTTSQFEKLKEEKNQTNFLDLNDDCMLEIFDYFEMYQLLILTKTCNRLKALIYSMSSRFHHVYGLGQASDTTFEARLTIQFSKNFYFFKYEASKSLFVPKRTKKL